MTLNEKMCEVGAANLAELMCSQLGTGGETTLIVGSITVERKDVTMVQSKNKTEVSIRDRQQVETKRIRELEQRSPQSVDKRSC